MSRTAEPALLRGGARVLMLSTMVMAAAAAVLALGTQDAHLLRLGVVAALWAALLAACTTVRARREISSRAQHADELRAAYQVELQREVVARREHALTVERVLREQAQVSQQREIRQLRAELAAIGGHLEQLLGGSLVQRVTLSAESARLLPPSAQLLPSSAEPILDGAGSRVAAATAAELAFGPVRSLTPTGAAASSPTDRLSSDWEFLTGEIPNGHGRHGAPTRQGLGLANSGDGSHHNGNGKRQAPADTVAAAGMQRTVSDLLAAHGVAAVPRRRRVHKDPRSA